MCMLWLAKVTRVTTERLTICRTIIYNGDKNYIDQIDIGQTIDAN